MSESCNCKNTDGRRKYCSPSCRYKVETEKMKQAVADWFKRTKEKAIAYKGGHCMVCKYQKCNAALEFHHLNPDEKSFQISDGICRAWQTIKAELDKCILLCRNCHAEHHYGELDLTEHLHKNPSIKDGDKTLVDKGYDPYYTRKKEPNHCVDCEKEISRKSTRCQSCAAAHHQERKFDPSPEKLERLVWEMPASKVGRHFGVSGRAVKKRCDKLGIETPGRGYWQKKRAGKL